MDRFVVIIDNLKRAQAPGVRPVSLGQPCQLVEQLKILLNHLLDPGPQHFNYHLGAVLQGCPVHLCHRCRRQGLNIKTGEMLTKRRV